MTPDNLPSPTIEIATEPVYNVLNSMALLNELEQKPALDAWIVRTGWSLSEEQRQRHALVFGPLRSKLLIEGNWHDFPTYLAALSEAQASEQIVAHLQALWEKYFAAEWQRTGTRLDNQTRQMQNSGLLTQPNQTASGLRSPEETVHALISFELWRDSYATTSAITRIIYVNSAHTGRYVTWLQTGNTLRIFFNAVRNFPAILRTTSIGRNELTSRLAALADATQLSILALFDRQDTLSAQEIMSQLDLTQSTVSRHIRPLLAFLNEGRGKGANKHYTFSPAQLELTFQAVRDVIAHGTPEMTYNDARLTFPEPLRRYMNREGKLTMLPLRQQDRQAALAVIAEQIEPGRNYSEKEVNALIQSQIAYDDFVTIRRELFSSRYLDREPNGSRYWKGEQA